MDNDLKKQAGRVRFLREQTGLSRRKMAQMYNLKEPTVRSWELDDASMSEQSMKKFLKGLAGQEIACRPDWIRRGVGQPPFMQDRPLLPMSKSKRSSHHSGSIEKEVRFFLKQGKNRVLFIVKDNCNEPAYAIGDTVGGVWMKDKPTEEYDGTLCIVGAPDLWDGYILRTLRIEDEGLVTLTSPRCEDNALLCPIWYNVPIVEWAPVIWYRKLNP